MEGERVKESRPGQMMERVGMDGRYAHIDGGGSSSYVWYMAIQVGACVSKLSVVVVVVTVETRLGLVRYRIVSISQPRGIRHYFVGFGVSEASVVTSLVGGGGGGGAEGFSAAVWAVSTAVGISAGSTQPCGLGRVRAGVAGCRARRRRLCYGMFVGWGWTAEL